MRWYTLLCFKRCICLSTVVFLRHMFWGQLRKPSGQVDVGWNEPRGLGAAASPHVLQSWIGFFTSPACHRDQTSDQQMAGDVMIQVRVCGENLASVPQALFFINPLVLPVPPPGQVFCKARLLVMYSDACQNSSVTHVSDKENLKYIPNRTKLKSPMFRFTEISMQTSSDIVSGDVAAISGRFWKALFNVSVQHISSSTLHLPYILLTSFWACSGSSGCLSENSAIGLMLESKYPGSRYASIRRKCCWSILVPLRWASPTTRNFGQPPCISSCIWPNYNISRT